MNLPPYMITSSCRRWLLWKLEPQKNSKLKKVPYYASGKKRNGKLDSLEDIAQLVSFDEVQMVLSQGGYTGLGFALGADNNGGFWQGIDFDGIDNKPELQRLITSLPGYVETSPSKNGVHAIGYGRQFTTLGSNKTGIEAYCSSRFFTVTGDNEFYFISSNLEDLADFVENTLNPLHKKRTDDTSVNAVVKTEIDKDSKLIDELRSALDYISVDNYHDWISVGHALKELGDIGFQLWGTWSAASPKFNGEKDLARWKGFSGERTNYRSIFKQAQKNGWNNPAKKSKQTKVDDGQAPQKHEEKQPSGIEKFPVIPVAEYAGLNHSPWLIKHIIPKAELVMVYGPSGSGKSFFALDLAFTVAQGIEWQGYKVSQGRVVYLAAEAGAGIRKRLLAYAIHNDIDLDDVPLDIIPAVPNFLNDNNVAELSEVIGKSSLIIIDTLACVAAGADENSSTDMGKVIGNCKLLHQLTGAVVMFVHHTGKDITKGARGWSGIRAAVDAEMELKPIERGFEMRITKLKDGEARGSYSFCIIPINLGEDGDGDVITSCVIHSTGFHKSDLSKPKGKWREKIMETIKKLSENQSSILKKDLIELIIYHDTEPLSEGKRDQRKSCISRALNGLINKGYYTEGGESILCTLQEPPPTLF